MHRSVVKEHHLEIIFLTLTAPLHPQTLGHYRKCCIIISINTRNTLDSNCILYCCYVAVAHSLESGNPTKMIGQRVSVLQNGTVSLIDFVHCAVKQPLLAVTVVESVLCWERCRQ